MGSLEPWQLPETLRGDPLSSAWLLASSVYHWEACGVPRAGWAHLTAVCLVSGQVTSGQEEERKEGRRGSRREERRKEEGRKAGRQEGGQAGWQSCGAPGTAGHLDGEDGTLRLWA